MADRKYSKEHEWVLVEGDVATVGISNYAQEQLGDVVYVELPDVDDDVEKDGECATIESVKAASEIYAPITGTITDTNGALDDKPELVNEDAEGAAWLFKMTIGDASELDGLMSEADYKSFVESLD